MKRRLDYLEGRAPDPPGPLSHLTDDELIDRARRERAVVELLHGEDTARAIEAEARRTP